MDFEFFEATRSKDISSNFFEEHSKSWQRPMKITEVACYISHKRLWEKISLSKEPSVVMEDDVLISKNLPNLINALEKKNEYEFINLENRGRKKFISKRGINFYKNYRLHRLYQDRTGAAGYILWPSGAQKLLKLEEKYGFALADAHITRCKNLVGFQVEPSPVIQSDMCSFYKLDHNCSSFFISTVSSQIKPIGGVTYFLRRVKAQMGLGLRIILLKLICEKRYVTLNKNEFEEVN